MEYDFSIVHRAGLNSQAAGALSHLVTVETDVSEIDQDILITAIVTPAQARQDKLVRKISVGTVTATTEPGFSVVSEYPTVQSTNAYRWRIRFTVGIRRSSAHFDKNEFVVRK